MARMAAVRDPLLEGGSARPWPLTTRSVGAVDDVMAIVAGMRARRCRGRARDRTHAPADGRTDTCAAPASGDRADNRPGAGANQATAQRLVGGIVGVCERGGRQHQTSAY
jgi:hypothetical protein